jgi:hypothetical protein
MLEPLEDAASGFMPPLDKQNSVKINACADLNAV